MNLSTYIVPEPGEETTLSIDDINDFYLRSFKLQAPTFINEAKVQILEYTQKEPLVFTRGHSAIIRVRCLM